MPSSQIPNCSRKWAFKTFLRSAFIPAAVIANNPCVTGSGIPALSLSLGDAALYVTPVCAGHSQTCGACRRPNSLCLTKLWG